jgi:hypothetical protein
MTPAHFPVGIQGTVTEKTVETVGILGLVAGKVFTFFVAEK